MSRQCSSTHSTNSPAPILVGSLSILLCGICVSLAQLDPMKAPPSTPVRSITDDYFGTKVRDPYRYLENLNDPEVKTWMKGQNEYARAVLAGIPGRNQLLARIRQLDEGVSARVLNVRRLPDGRYFYKKSLASEDVAKLYVRQGMAGQERLLFDPEKLATPGGAHFSIDGYYPSHDGKNIAVWVSPGGSGESTLHVLDTATGLTTGEAIDRTWVSSLGWRPDGHSFFYVRAAKLGPDAPPAETYQRLRVYLHAVGTNPEKDVPVFGYEVSSRVKMDIADTPLVDTVPGSPYAFGSVVSGTQDGADLYLAPIMSVGNPDTPWRKVYGVEDAVTRFEDHGDYLYVLTSRNVPRFKIVRTKLSDPDFPHAEVVVAPEQAVIKDMATAADALYVQLLDGGVGRLLRVPYDAIGAPEYIELPFQGAVSLKVAESRLPGVLFEMTSWTKARKIYAYDVQLKRVADTGLQPSGPSDNPPDLVSIEVKAKSHDGTLVPLSIVHKRGLKLNGLSPTLLQGFGLYGASFDPAFDPKFTAWLERGAVLAIAHVRGGGEYGEEWHKAGMKLTKPNTWRDFIACAEYLIDKKYTSSGRLAAWSYSGGGITIGRAITERPDLFGAAIVQAGVFDTLRFEFTPNGVLNIFEFGSVKTLEGFKGLLAMSSFNHIRDGVRYPAFMAVTSLNDTNVDPSQTAKMIARLQAATVSGKPILWRLDEEGGHGVSTTRSQEQVNFADQLAFLFWQLEKGRDLGLSEPEANILQRPQ
jgi:prolyl oligopeptidase